MAFAFCGLGLSSDQSRLRIIPICIQSNYQSITAACVDISK